jgi:hypothetical protein
MMADERGTGIFVDRRKAGTWGGCFAARCDVLGATTSGGTRYMQCAASRLGQTAQTSTEVKGHTVDRILLLFLARRHRADENLFFGALPLLRLLQASINRFARECRRTLSTPNIASV